MDIDGQWPCLVCTLINDRFRGVCDACGTARPGEVVERARAGPARDDDDDDDEYWTVGREHAFARPVLNTARNAPACDVLSAIDVRVPPAAPPPKEDAVTELMEALGRSDDAALMYGVTRVYLPPDLTPKCASLAPHWS